MKKQIFLIICFLFSAGTASTAGVEFLCDKETLKIITFKESPAIWGSSELNAFYVVKNTGLTMKEAEKFRAVYKENETLESNFDKTLISKTDMDALKKDNYVTINSTGSVVCSKELR